MSFQEKPSGTKEIQNLESYFSTKKLEVCIPYHLDAWTVNWSLQSSLQYLQGFKVAYVVYKKNESLRKAMTMKWSNKYLSSEDKPIKTGISSNFEWLWLAGFGLKPLIFLFLFAEWMEDYESSFIDSKRLQQEIDKYMSDFDQKKQVEEENMRLTEGKPDDDGWITVTKQ